MIECQGFAPFASIAFSREAETAVAYVRITPEEPDAQGKRIRPP
jgi:hypothetical protein